MPEWLDVDTVMGMIGGITRRGALEVMKAIGTVKIPGVRAGVISRKAFEAWMEEKMPATRYTEAVKKRRKL